MKIICSKCRRPKKRSQFYPNRAKKKLNPMCKMCQSQYHKHWYRKNRKKEKVVKRARTRNLSVNERNSARVQKLKDVPCADCGHKYPHWIMQFDHVKGKKVDDVCRLQRYASEEVLLAEVAKCDVVCANCHCNRTHLRRIGEWPAPSGTV